MSRPDFEASFTKLVIEALGRAATLREESTDTSKTAMAVPDVTDQLVSSLRDALEQDVTIVESAGRSRAMRASELVGAAFYSKAQDPTVVLEKAAKRVRRQLAKMGVADQHVESAVQAVLEMQAPRAGSSRRKSGRKSTPKRQGARPRRKQGAAGQVLRLINDQPGLTTRELADALGAKPQNLYKVIYRLRDKGKVIRVGKAWHPTKQVRKRARSSRRT